jgi:putative endonuclease
VPPHAYRPFALLAFAVALVGGLPLGLWLLGWLYLGARAVPPGWLLLHAHLQIFGFFGTLIMGVAQHLLPRFTGRPVEFAGELGRRGYKIVDCNYRCRLGEIDLIAKDGDTLVFVEVRSHKSLDFGTPAESVTLTKQQKLIRTARIYLSQKQLEDASCRFDVAEVTFDGDKAKVEIIKDAFGAEW